MNAAQKLLSDIGYAAFLGKVAHARARKPRQARTYRPNGKRECARRRRQLARNG